MQRYDRAARRAASKKKKQEAEKKLRSWGLKEEDMTERMIGRHADNMALCSCTMCGNPRKWFNKKTIQELRCECDSL